MCLFEKKKTNNNTKTHSDKDLVQNNRGDFSLIVLILLRE